MSFHNKEGEKIPAVTFKTRANGQWKDISSDDIFSGKTVAVFSLPGAFTPTCSSSHVPRYEELHETLKENGIDEIICISVNDAFVMDEWKKNQKVSHVTFLPDGNGEFTKGMGMLVSKNDLGFGNRSWRYSMIVKNGVVEKMFIEPENPGDPYGVSDADTMLNFLNPNAEKPKAITIFTRNFCPFCHKAKTLMNQKGLHYEEMIVGENITSTAYRTITGKNTVPQIFIEGKNIGGSDDLEKYFS